MKDRQHASTWNRTTEPQTAGAPGRRVHTEVWAELLRTLAITSGSLFANAAPWEQIQRQEDPGGDVAQLRAALENIAAEAIATRAAIRSSDMDRFRQLASAVEALAPELDAITDAAARAELDLVRARTQDEIVLGFQMVAAYHANSTLEAWHAPNTTDDQRDAQRGQYLQGSGYPYATVATEDWCGMFANTQLRAAGFAPELNVAFNESSNPVDFFTYVATNRSPGVIQPHGTGDELAVRDYHEQRGSLRSWLSGEAIGDDIRPGDLLVLDWQGDGDPDHMCLVASYTPGIPGQPGRLVTVDGNAYGARRAGEMANTTWGNKATNDVSTSVYERTGADTYDRSAMLPDTKGEPTMTMVGRGRPSVVDFESGHLYPEFSGRNARDPDGPSGPLQSRRIQRDGSGEVAARDPHAAFESATAGAPAEIPFRAEMQSRLGADFSSVKAYTGRDLAPLGARAATRGEQVAFSSASPDKETIAHELTHVLQARQGRAGGAAVSDPGDASEHEAREVGAAVTAGRSVSVGGAPSAAIQRQEDDGVPTAVHPTAPGNRQDVTIDWSSYTYFISRTYRLPVNNTQPTSIGEVRDFFFLRHIGRELPAVVAEYGPLPDESVPSDPGRVQRRTAVDGLSSLIQTRLHELIAAGDHGTADEIRIRLFAANQHALADALLIPGSTRHKPVANAEGQDTWCNVYAFDVVNAMGGYLPRQWWTDDAIEDFAAGEEPSSARVTQLTANQLYDWMEDWGVPHFGWDSVTTPEEAQAEANLGRIVIILASTGDEDIAGSGHVSVVMTKTEDRQPPTATETNNEYVPLQSQAGAQNFATNAEGVPREQVGGTGRRAWWNDGLYRNLDGAGFGFFVYRADRANRGFGDISVRAPEEMGTILPGGS
ncbi:MAG TPA: DUF4157 domain-containing protein [Kofleriaceae bacterium]